MTVQEGKVAVGRDVMLQTVQGGKGPFGIDVMLQSVQRGMGSFGRDVMLQTVQGGKWLFGRDVILQSEVKWSVLGDVMLKRVQGGGVGGERSNRFASGNERPNITDIARGKWSGERREVTDSA